MSKFLAQHILQLLIKQSSWRPPLLTVCERMACLSFCSTGQVSRHRLHGIKLKDFESWECTFSPKKTYRRRFTPCASYQAIPRMRSVGTNSFSAAYSSLDSGIVSTTPDPTRTAVGNSEIALRHSSAPPGTAAQSRVAHNEIQSNFFDDNHDYFGQPVPDDVKARVKEIVGAAALQTGERILDVGAGTGALTESILESGVTDITAVDLSLMMLSQLKERFDDVTCWHGDGVDLPLDFGTFDAIFFNAMFANVHSQSEALAAAVRVANPGCRIVISHPLGAAFVDRLRSESPAVVPHSLPDQASVAGWTQTLPLEVLLHRNDPNLYITLFRVTGAGKPPLYLKASVVAGFGRGSKQMGVPTANLDPQQVQRELEGAAGGVYYGFARVGEVEGGEVHPMVMNVGQRPTFADGDGLSVEVHVLHAYGEDFYGKSMAVVVLGYIRPEMGFASVDELVRRIHTDIEIAREKLKTPELQKFRGDPFFA